jgi:hypothetical protein
MRMRIRHIVRAAALALAAASAAMPVRVYRMSEKTNIGVRISTDWRDLSVVSSHRP